MKKILFISMGIIMVLFSQRASAEEIKNYEVHLQLHKDARVTVTEDIEYDFGSFSHHGIFRFIPLYFQVKGQEKEHAFQQRKILIKNLSVNRDNSSEFFVTKKHDQNHNFYIKIGQKNKTISGTHHYKIKYDVLGSLRYFENYDELYLNAIGLDWKAPIKSANVILECDDIPFQNISCYVGKLKDTYPCNVKKITDTKIIFQQDFLGSHEGLTVAASFPKGSVEKKEFFAFTTKIIFTGIIFLFIVLISFLFYLVRRYQRKYFYYDPIHPRYAPPENLDAMFVGYLADRKLDARDISAGIIQLARDGYIEIEKIENSSFFGKKKDYQFTLLKNIEGSVLDSYKKSLVDLLFQTASFQKEGKKVTSKMSILRSHRNTRLQISSIFSLLKQKSKLEKYTEGKDISLIIIPFLFFTFTFISFFFGSSLGVFFFILTFISIITSSFIPSTIKARYTKKGWKTEHAIGGFKLFLEMTEKERYELFNNPAENPQEFMEYLPYAIALGVEKKWAKQFASITIPQPEWYKGTGPFAAAGFASEIFSFTQSVTSSVATTASSGSGSGGGGFSGGGSGGGGGGSW